MIPISRKHHHSPFSIEGRLSEFSWIMVAKTQKIRKSVSLTDSDVQTFLEGKENQYTKEKPKVAYSVASVMAFLTAENENLEDMPQTNLAV